MDHSVTWSPEAVEDLKSIAEYIERDSLFYAKSVVSKVLTVLREIGKFPFFGRVVPEIGDASIRERFVYSYRLVYQIRSNKILVVAIIHGKRLLENITDRFEE